MLFYVVGFAILAYTYVKDFKKGFMMYLCFNTFLVQNITIVSVPGFPVLSLDLFMAMMLVFFFFLHGAKCQTAHIPFPLRKPFFLLIFSTVLSMVFSVSGIGVEVSSTVKSMIELILLPWLIWEVIDDENDYMFIFKGLTIAFFISCVYGLFEYIIKNNPLMVYEMTLNNDVSKIIDFSYSTSSRGYRIQSVFEHAIGAGINWAMYAVFAFAILTKKEKIPMRGVCVITGCLSIPCIILTKMRSSIFFFAISLLSIVNLKSRKFYRLAMFLLVILILISPLLAENINIILSFVSREAQEVVGGSNASMRFQQLNAALELLMLSPIWGLGQNFQNVIQIPAVDKLLGLESVWFRVIPSYGLVGIVAYVVLIYYSIIKIPYHFKSPSIAFLALAYWSTYTLSSLPGMKMYLYYIIIFYYIKTSRYYIEKAQEGKIYGVYIKDWKIKYNRIK